LVIVVIASILALLVLVCCIQRRRSRSSASSANDVKFSAVELESYRDNEKYRLQTFNDNLAHPWPHAAPTPADLAAAGFVFRPTANDYDRTVCPHCMLVVRQWKAIDVPFEVHKLDRSSCPFVQANKALHQQQQQQQTMPSAQELPRTTSTVAMALGTSSINLNGIASATRTDSTSSGGNKRQSVAARINNLVFAPSSKPSSQKAARISEIEVTPVEQFPARKVVPSNEMSDHDREAIMKRQLDTLPSLPEEQAIEEGVYQNVKRIVQDISRESTLDAKIRELERQGFSAAQAQDLLGSTLSPTETTSDRRMHQLRNIGFSDRQIIDLMSGQIVISGTPVAPPTVLPMPELTTAPRPASMNDNLPPMKTWFYASIKSRDQAEGSINGGPYSHI
jgi:hypothetical protein